MPQLNVVKQFEPESFYHIYNHSVAEVTNLYPNNFADHFIDLFRRYLTKPKLRPKDEHDYPSYHGDIELLCYCLMNNHFHALVYQHTEHGIESFMRSLGTAYSMYYNKRRERRGRVFESTYKASKIDNESYMTYISRYIHLNPEAMGIDPAIYKYSSYRQYLLEDPPADWLITERVMAEFRSVADYRNYMQQK